MDSVVLVFMVPRGREGEGVRVQMLTFRASAMRNMATFRALVAAGLNVPNAPSTTLHLQVPGGAQSPLVDDADLETLRTGDEIWVHTHTEAETRPLDAAAPMQVDGRGAGVAPVNGAATPPAAGSAGRQSLTASRTASRLALVSPTSATTPTGASADSRTRTPSSAVAPSTPGQAGAPELPASQHASPATASMNGGARRTAHRSAWSGVAVGADAAAGGTGEQHDETGAGADAHTRSRRASTLPGGVQRVVLSRRNSLADAIGSKQSFTELLQMGIQVTNAGHICVRKLPADMAAMTGIPAAPPGRRVGIADIRDNFPGDVSFARAARALSMGVVTTLHTVYGLQSLRVAAGTGEATSAFYVIATKGWQRARTLVVVVPPVTELPGMIDTDLAFLFRVADGTVVPLVAALQQRLHGPAAAAPESASHEGDKDPAIIVVAATRHEDAGRSSLRPLPTQLIAHSLWDQLLGGRGGHPDTLPSVSFVAHGSGCDVIAALLEDPTRGPAARARTRCAAFLNPASGSRVLQAAAAGVARVGTAASSESFVAAVLHGRSCIWTAASTPAAAEVVQINDPEIHGQGVAAAGALAAPWAVDASTGCYTSAVTVAVSIPRDVMPVKPGPASASLARGRITSFDAAPEVASAVACAALPALVAAEVAAFVEHMQSAASVDQYVLSAGADRALVRCVAGAASKPSVAMARRTSAPSLVPADARAAEAQPLPRAASAMLSPQHAGMSTPPRRVATGATTPSAAAGTPSMSAGLANGAASASAVASPQPAFKLPPAVPEPFTSTAATALQRVKDLFADTNKPGGGTKWKANGFNEGVRMYIKVGDDDLVGARGDYVMPYPMSAFFNMMIASEQARYELDATLDKLTLIQDVTSQITLSRMQMKGVMFTDPRDFVTLSGWELDADGTLYSWATSVTDDRAPPAKGYVRGNLEIGGWVVTPLTAAEYEAERAQGLGPRGAGPPPKFGACKVTYMFRLSIGGSIPPYIIKQVSASQAALPATALKLLDKRYGRTGNVKPLASLPPVENLGEPAAVAIAADPDGVMDAPAPDAEPAVREATADHIDTAAAHASDAAASAPAPSGGAAAMPEPPAAKPSAPRRTFNLSGTWKPNKTKSESMTPMLVSMGVPWIARKMLDGLEITLIIEDKFGEFTYTEQSSLGGSPTTVPLDWSLLTIPGGDGKELRVRGYALAGTDDVVGDPHAVVHAAKERVDVIGTVYPPHGKKSGCIITEAVLPSGLGMTRDTRHLVSPTELRVVTTYLKDGVEKNRITRYYNLSGEPAPPHAAPAVPESDPAAAQGTVASTRRRDDLVVATAVSEPSPAVAPTPRSMSETPAAADRLRAESTAGSAATTTPRSESLAERASARAASTAVSGDAPSLASPSSTSKPLSVTPGGAGAAVKSAGTPGAGSPWSAARWIPDAQAHMCFACRTSFTTFNRRHHCRSCGQAFCDTHSRARMPLAHLPPEDLVRAGIDPSGLVRVCDECAKPMVYESTRVDPSGGVCRVTGGNFGTLDAALAGKLSVTILDAPGFRTNPSIEAAHTALKFSVPAGGQPRRVAIDVAGRRGTFEVHYNVPTIVSVDDLDTDGGPAVLSGSLFPMNAADATKFKFAVNGVDCPLLRVVAPGRSVQIRMPAGCGGTDRNRISVALDSYGVVSEFPFAYASPCVISVRSSVEVSARSPDELEHVLYVLGANFGAAVDKVQVTALDIPCLHVSMPIPHSKLRVVLDPLAVKRIGSGAWTTADVQVRVAGQAAMATMPRAR